MYDRAGGVICELYSKSYILIFTLIVVPCTEAICNLFIHEMYRYN